MAQTFPNVSPYVAGLVNNLYGYLTLVVGAPFILGNIDTMHVHNDTNNVITKTNQNLTKSWTSGDASGMLDADWFTVTGGDKNWEQDASAQELQDFLDGKKGGFDQSATGYPIWNYSQLVVTQILNLVAKFYNDKPVKGNQAGDNSTVNALNSIVSSQANLEEQPGQNLAKTEGGVLQNDAGTQQTATSCIDSFLQTLGNLASLVQQLYS